MNKSDLPAGFVASDSQAQNDDCDIVRVSPRGRHELTDLVSIEEPLEIRLCSADRDEFTLAITMRTPGNDHELVLGFLYGEGIIRSRADCVNIEHCRPPSQDRGLHNVIRVELAAHVSIDPARLARHFYTSSSCGVCGKTSIESVTSTMSSPVSNSLHLPVEKVFELPARLKARQTEFAKTGGLHAAGLISPGGDLLGIREDVGRHNAMDKLIGSLLLEGDLPLVGHGLLLSGRASFELLQKAAVAGIEAIAAIGPPSSLAIELAREKGISLAGFLREDGFNLYAHPGRFSS